MTIATAVAGCGHVIAGTPVMQALAGEDKCAQSSGPMVTIDPQSDGEPVMRIPQPPNWKRDTRLDSQLIRYVMTNHALVADRFSAYAAVTLEDVTSKDISAEQVIASEWASVRTIGGASELTVTSNRSVCGYPAQTVTYTVPQIGAIPTRFGTALAVVTPGVRKYAAVITVQSADPTNPTYKADAQTIIDGFQIMPETGGNH
ncbi:MAG TPA: hypothetical protein VFB19_07070 [Mycobacterium sp.]|nr:hypothetical protein [Mycobacterium sp.]